MLTPPAAQPASPDHQHNPALDGIRGLAILLVLASHMVYVNQQATGALYVWARAIRDSLWCGVDIFFTLSGFLITGILVRTLGAPGYFRNFFGRRSLRIFPLYYLVLLLLILCAPFLHFTWGGQLLRLLTYSNHPFPPLHSSQWSFYFGGHVSLVNFWSLHIEEQFYIFWPFLVYFLRLPRRLLIATAALSLLAIGLRIYLAAHGVSHVALYSSLITRTDSLLAGAALSLLLYTPLRHRVLKHAPVALGILLAALMAQFFIRHGIFAESDSPTLFSLQFTFLALTATALIAVCLDSNSLAFRLFSARPLRFFGKYSYGMYIFHSILPMFLLPPLERATAPWASHAAALHLLITATELTATIALSLLSFHLFEARFLRLKRLFSYRVPETRAAITEPHAIP